MKEQIMTSFTIQNMNIVATERKVVKSSLIKIEKRNTPIMRSKWKGKRYIFKDEVEVVIKDLKNLSIKTSACFLTSETSTAGYQGEYEDIIIHENDGSVTAYVRGQKTGRDDHLIIEAIEMKEKIHVLHRKSSKDPFTFIGSGTGIVSKERVTPFGVTTNDVQNMTLFKIIVQAGNIQNIICPPIIIGGRNQRKLGGLRNIGYTHTSIQTCFYRQ